MGYKIQPVQTNLAVDNTALGVEINFNGPGVFVPVYSTDQQSLNNLKNLLLTRIGERYDNPTYGTNLLNIIFQPNVEELKSDIIDIITVSVNRWMPDVTLEQIIVLTAEDDPTLDHDIRVTINFSAISEKVSSIVINANETGQLTII